MVEALVIFGSVTSQQQNRRLAPLDTTLEDFWPKISRGRVLLPVPSENSTDAKSLVTQRGRVNLDVTWNWKFKKQRP